jgi:type IV secretory pathway TraG/TraD family ATPase VirD4
MAEFYLGYPWKPKSGRIKRRPETVDLTTRPHVSMTAPTGSSKGVSIEIPNLLTGLKDCSVFNIDSSGQNAAVCAEARRQMGHRFWPINPKQVHVAHYPDLASVGHNPMDALDVNNPARFLMRATSIAEALAPMQRAEGNSKFFDTGARMLATGLIMYVKLRDGDKAHLGTVRDLLTEEEETDDDDVPVKGLRCTAMRAVAMGHRATANLLARFTKETRSNRDIISTLDNATRILDDDDIRADLAKSETDFGTLKDVPTTVMLIVPAGTEQQFLSPWLRILVNAALDSIYARGDGAGLQVVFMLSEAAQIGRLDPVVAAIGQDRKYGVSLAPIVWQDLNQPREIFGDNNAKTLLANSGCLFAFNPGNDIDTSEFLSKLAGEHLVPGLSVTDDPQRPDRGSISPQRERLWSPELIRSLPVRHALVWKAGEAQPLTLYCPPYWDIEACRRVARIDPFHPTMPPAAGRRGPMPLLGGLFNAAVALGLLAAAFALAGQHHSGELAGVPHASADHRPAPWPVAHRRQHAMR